MVFAAHKGMACVALDEPAHIGHGVHGLSVRKVLELV